MKKTVFRLFILALFSLLFINNPIFAQKSVEQDKANEFLKKGKYSEARKKYRSLINKLSIHEPEIILPYFKTFLATGEYTEGLKETDKLLVEYPDNAVLLNARGKFLTETGKYEEAKSLFENPPSNSASLTRGFCDSTKALNRLVSNSSSLSRTDL